MRKPATQSGLTAAAAPPARKGGGRRAVARMGADFAVQLDAAPRADSVRDAERVRRLVASLLVRHLSAGPDRGAND